jgi:hypothetical protein
MNRIPHLLLRWRPRLLLFLLAVLLAGHGVILYYAASEVTVSAGVLLGLIVLLVIKHLGVLGPVYALFRRRGARNRRGIQVEPNDEA